MFILSQMAVNDHGDMELIGKNEAGETTSICIADAVLQSVSDAISDRTRLLAEKRGEVPATPIESFDIAYAMVENQPKLVLYFRRQGEGQWLFSLPLALCGEIQKSLQDFLSEGALERHLGRPQ